MTLYNDSDPFVCAWLRELIAAGHLPAGEVLSTPIESLHDERLSTTTTFHAFAGIGVLTSRRASAKLRSKR